MCYFVQSDAIKVSCNVSGTHTNEHHGHNEGDPFAHVSTFADVHAEEKISDFLKLNLSGRISATNVWRLLVVELIRGTLVSLSTITAKMPHIIL